MYLKFLEVCGTDSFCVLSRVIFELPRSRMFCPEIFLIVPTPKCSAPKFFKLSRKIPFDPIVLLIRKNIKMPALPKKVTRIFGIANEKNGTSQIYVNTFVCAITCRLWLYYAQKTLARPNKPGGHPSELHFRALETFKSVRSPYLI